jgi:hypothetical protein
MIGAPPVRCAGLTTDGTPVTTAFDVTVTAEVRGL